MANLTVSARTRRRLAEQAEREGKTVEELTEEILRGALRRAGAVEAYLREIGAVPLEPPKRSRKAPRPSRARVR